MQQMNCGINQKGINGERERDRQTETGRFLFLLIWMHVQSAGFGCGLSFNANGLPCLLQYCNNRQRLGCPDKAWHLFCSLGFISFHSIIHELPHRFFLFFHFLSICHLRMCLCVCVVTLSFFLVCLTSLSALPSFCLFKFFMIHFQYWITLYAVKL